MSTKESKTEKPCNIDIVRRSLSDKQKRILKYMDKGYAFKHEDEGLILFTDTDEKIPIDWEKDCKPFYEMDLIAIGRNTTLGFTYIPLNERGKMAYK